MPNIFISYRRMDSEGYAGRLYDHLTNHYDDSEIFLDVAEVAKKAGKNFIAVIQQAIGSCSALLAVIGPRWLTVVDRKGRRRLDHPKDYVRLEIATALKRKIPVYPVLVRRATMPQRDELPQALATLATCQALELSHDRFAYDVERLMEAIGGASGTVHVFGPTGRSPLDTTSRLFRVGENPAYRVEIDSPSFKQKPVIHLRKELTLSEEKGRRWMQASVRVPEGVYTIRVGYRAEKSKRLTFKLKGGQTATFSFAWNYSSHRDPYRPNLPKRELILTPYKPVEF